MPHRAESSDNRDRIMNMLHLNWIAVWSMGPNAGIPSVYETLRGYVKRGNTLHIVLPAFKSQGSDAADCGDLDNVVVHLVRMPLFLLARKVSAWGRNRSDRGAFYGLVFWLFALLADVVFTVTMAFNALKIARREKFDIVYAHHSICAACGFIVGRVLGRPVICRLYGTPLKSWVRRGKRAIRLRYPGLSLPFLLPFDRLIAVDDGSDMDKVAEYFGTDMSRFRMWVNGIQPYHAPAEAPAKEAIARNIEGLAPDAAWVLVVGRLITEKRYDRVIRSLPLILAQCPQTQLVIVGSGQELGALTELAHSLNLDDRVVFTGALGHADIMPIRLVSEVFVSMSERSNRLNVLREAFQCGLPVITVDDGTTRDMIEDGVNGLFVEKDDPSQLAMAVTRVLDDPDLRATLSQGALASARALWSWDDRMTVETDDIAAMMRQWRPRHRRRRPRSGATVSLTEREP